MQEKEFIINPVFRFYIRLTARLLHRKYLLIVPQIHFLVFLQAHKKLVLYLLNLLHWDFKTRLQLFRYTEDLLLLGIDKSQRIRYQSIFNVGINLGIGTKTRCVVNLQQPWFQILIDYHIKAQYFKAGLTKVIPWL